MSEQGSDGGCWRLRWGSGSPYLDYYSKQNSSSYYTLPFFKPKQAEKVEPSNAQTCDVVFANASTGELSIIRGEENWPSKDEYEPIGIVVIPGEHGVLKDGTGEVNQCGVMSIVGMKASNPTSGGSDETIGWGQYNTDISGQTDGLGRYDSTSNGLTNYNSCVSVSSSDQTTPTGSTAYPYVPRQGLVGGNATWSNSSYAPSPYADKTTMNSGGFNSAYSNTSRTSANCLSDFSGIVNTKILTDKATGQSDWRTGITITNTSSSTGSTYASAACTCARYKTTGTKAFVNCTNEELKNGTGFLYLPAMGELCYIMPRLYDINDTISKLSIAYGIGVKLDTGHSYWSSSEYSERYACCMSTNNGTVGSNTKLINCYVRAFLRLDNSYIDKPKPGVYIEDIDGNLYIRSTWDSSKTPNSIVVVSYECNVRLALTENSSTMQIHSSYSGELEKYMTAISDSSKAKADYNGKENTANIMKLQSSTSYAAGYCNNFTFPDGKTKGHLPSLGELWTLYQNKAEVDACLSACGGTAMNTSSYYWSSTFWGVTSSAYRYCWILKWSDGDVGSYYLNSSGRVRPVSNY